MSSLVLAFDTSTEQVAIALGERDGSHVVAIAVRDILAPRAALGVLLPAVDEVLSSAGLVVRDLAGIVVGRGPGSFTGVRIAVATAKGLAHGAGLPLVGVSTLDAVAWGHAGHRGLVGVLGDAMRGEVYPALYRSSAQGLERLSADSVVAPETAAAEWGALGEPILLTGNALLKYADRFEGLGQIAPQDSWAISGAGLLAAYSDLLAHDEGAGGDAGSLLPVYTRLSDAEENERAAQRRLSVTGAPGEPPASGVAGPAGGEG